MPNYKLLIEYDGTNYSGWQIQCNAKTVQGEIEKALFIILKEKVRLTAAGRTDSGVHALEQVANFKCMQEINSNKKLINSLNGITNPDIVIKETEKVDDAFNARYYAKARQYAYRISTCPKAVARQYCHTIHTTLDLESMQQASIFLQGSHNFEAFTQRNPEEKHYLCSIETVEWVVNKCEILFRIRANRFLRNMVRRIVGTLLELGRGKISVQSFREMVEQQKNKDLAVTAPAKGLFLEKVIY